MTNQTLHIIDGYYTIHRYGAEDAIPVQIYESSFYWISKTDEELSIICDSKITLDSNKREDEWKVIKIIGPIEFSEVGVIATLTNILARNGISVFVISTFDTDYVLIKQNRIEKSVRVLKEAGYLFI